MSYNLLLFTQGKCPVTSRYISTQKDHSHMAKTLLKCAFSQPHVICKHLCSVPFQLHQNSKQPFTNMNGKNLAKMRIPITHCPSN